MKNGRKNMSKDDELDVGVEIKTTLDETVKEIERIFGKGMDCFVSENEVKEGFDLIIRIPLLESKLMRLARKLVPKEEFEQYMKELRKLK